MSEANIGSDSEILRLANAVSGQLDITQQGREICERLALEVGETVNIAVLRSHYAVNVEQAREDRRLSVLTTGSAKRRPFTRRPAAKSC